MFPHIIFDFHRGFNFCQLYNSLDNWHLLFYDNCCLYLWIGKWLFICNDYFRLISINNWLWGYWRMTSTQVINNVETIWAHKRELISFLIIILIKVLKHYQFLSPFLLFYLHLPDLHVSKSILLNVVRTFKCFYINVFKHVLRDLRGITVVSIINWVNAQPSVYCMSHHLLFLLVKRPVNRNTGFLSRHKYTVLNCWNVLVRVILVRYDFPHFHCVCYFSSPWVSDTQWRHLNWVITIDNLRLLLES